MKKKLRLFSINTISARLMAVFLMVTIPILVISIIMFRNDENRRRENLLESMSVQLDSFKQRFDTEYERIGRTQLALTSDTDLNNLVDLSDSMGDYMRTITIRRLQERLRDIYEGSDYIRNISVYLSSIDAVVSSPGRGRFIYDTLQEHPTQPKSAQGGFIMFQEETMSLVLTSARRDESGRQLYTIETGISQEKLSKDMEEAVSSIPGGIIMFSNDTGKILVESGDKALQHEIIAMRGNIHDDGYLYMREGEYRDTTWLIVQKESQVPGVALLVYVDAKAFMRPLKVYSLWILSLLGVFLLVTIVYAIVVRTYISSPVALLLEHFERLEQGDLKVRIHSPTKRERNEFDVLYRKFNGMVERLDSAVIQVYQQEILTQRAQLKQLQAQISPHFLYNTYFLLHRLIKQQDPYAVQFSRFIGEYFRYITKNDEDTVSFAEEAAHATLYANIQAVRFRGRITVHVGKLPEGMGEITVPRLILQPILENAFLHGLEAVEEGGVLWVEFMRHMGEWVVLVTNNGGQMPTAEMERLLSEVELGVTVQDSSGLVNIHRRLRLAFGGNSGLRFYNLLDGVQVCIVIDCQTEGLPQ